jgi:hypothetical protein
LDHRGKSIHIPVPIVQMNIKHSKENLSAKREKKHVITNFLA